MKRNWKLFGIFMVVIAIFILLVSYAFPDMSYTQKTAWWLLTAAACIFMGAFCIAKKEPPPWWQTVIAIVVAISGIILGKPWALPPGP